MRITVCVLPEVVTLHLPGALQDARTVNSVATQARSVEISDKHVFTACYRRASAGEIAGFLFVITLLKSQKAEQGLRSLNVEFKAFLLKHLLLSSFRLTSAGKTSAAMM